MTITQILMKLKRELLIIIMINILLLINLISLQRRKVLLQDFSDVNDKKRLYY